MVFRILYECGIIADVQEKHCVEISDCRGNGTNLYLKGTKSDIATARKAMTKELKVAFSNLNFAFYCGAAIALSLVKSVLMLLLVYTWKVKIVYNKSINYQTCRFFCNYQLANFCSLHYLKNLGAVIHCA